VNRNIMYALIAVILKLLCLSAITSVHVILNTRIFSLPCPIVAERKCVLHKIIYKMFASAFQF